MSRYIQIKTTGNNNVWINSDRIMALDESESHHDRLIIRLDNGDSIVTRDRDALDILSMLDLDVQDSCGALIADTPGVPARTELQYDMISGVHKRVEVK